MDRFLTIELTAGSTINLTAIAINDGALRQNWRKTARTGRAKAANQESARKKYLHRHPPAFRGKIPKADAGYHAKAPAVSLEHSNPAIRRAVLQGTVG